MVVSSFNVDRACSVYVDAPSETHMFPANSSTSMLCPPRFLFVFFGIVLFHQVELFGDAF